MLAALVQTEITKAVEPALSTLAQTILGAICLVCIFVAGVAIWQLIRVQNARATDQKTFREEYKGLVDHNSSVFEKMTASISSLKDAITALTDQERNSQDVLRQLRDILNSMQNTQNLLLLQSGNRRFSPPAGLPAQSVQSPSSGGKRETR